MFSKNTLDSFANVIQLIEHLIGSVVGFPLEVHSMRGWVRGLFTSFRSSESITGLHVVLILILGLICYSNTFSVPFYFDDYKELVNDTGISGNNNPWTMLLHAGPRRVADFTFALNHKIHGLNVVGYHVTNLVIHLSAAVALYFFISAVLQALDLFCPRNASDSCVPYRATHRFIPLAASLLFVSHPLQTQAVTYIIQRYTSLAGFFYISTMLAYVKGRTRFELHGFNGAVAGWGLSGAVSALLGFYTKPSVYSIPLMLLMLEMCLFRGRYIKSILLIIGTTGTLLFGVKTLPLLLNGGTISELVYHLRDASSVDFFTSRTSYFLTQLRVIVTYLRLLIVPVGQRLEYDYPNFSTLLNIEVAASLTLHIILVALALGLYLRSRHLLTAASERHGHVLHLIVVGIGWFYIALSVTSSFIPIPDDIVEHRMYLPSAGLFIAFAALVQLITEKLKDGLRYQQPGLAILCLILALVTISRNHVWGDELRFWQNEVRLSPNKGRVHANLGYAYLRQGNDELALRNFVYALKLDPTLQEVWISLGSVLRGLGRYQSRFTTGEEYLTPERGIDYRYYKLFYSNTFNTMGLANEFIGQPEEALTWYNKSLALNPKSDIAWYNLGLLSFRLGITGQMNIALKKLKELDSDLSAALESRIKNEVEDG